MAVCPHCKRTFEQDSQIYQCPKCKGELCVECYFQNTCPLEDDG